MGKSIVKKIQLDEINKKNKELYTKCSKIRPIVNSHNDLKDFAFRKVYSNLSQNFNLPQIKNKTRNLFKSKDKCLNEKKSFIFRSCGT